MDKALGGGHTIQRIIVKNHQFFVAGKLHVQFNTVAVLGGGGKGGQAVFGRALILAEITAVGAVMPAEGNAQLRALGAGPDAEQHKGSQHK